MTERDPNTFTNYSGEMELWLHFGDNDVSTMVWRESIAIDLGRFQADDIYADRLSNHITHALELLAKEVAELAICKNPTPEEKNKDGQKICNELRPA